MTTLQDVMVRDPIRVGAAATMAEAAAGMAGARIGSLLVEDAGEVVGILTERDVVRVAGADADLFATAVSDWMTVDPTTAPREQDIREAATTMIAGGFRHLPVTDGDAVVGIVSMRSILGAIVGGPEHGAGMTPDGTRGVDDPAPTTSPASVRDRRTQLFRAARRLRDHGESAADDPVAWRAGLRDVLDVLHEVVTAHVVATEGPDGFLEELVRESEGRLSASVRRLGREHERITATVARLRADVEAVNDPPALRRSAEELFAQLEAHRHRGSDLLWRAYADEIGTGD